MYLQICSRESCLEDRHCRTTFHRPPSHFSPWDSDPLPLVLSLFLLQFPCMCAHEPQCATASDWLRFTLNWLLVSSTALLRQIARSVTTSFKVGLCIYGRLGPWQIYLLKLDLRNVVAVDCELTGLQCGGWDWGHLRSRLKKCGRFMTICKPSLCHGQVLSLLQQLEEDLWYQEKKIVNVNQRSWTSLTRMTGASPLQLRR